MNNQFVFDGKTKGFTFALMGIGALCLGLTGLIDGDAHYIRFWTNLLHNSVFFVGIAFAALFFLATHTLAWGGWYITFKRVPEAMMMFLPFGAVLMSIIALAVFLDLPGTELLYLWSDERVLNPDDKANFDALVYHKSSLLNPTIYFLTIAVLAIWTFFANKMRSLSVQQDQSEALRVENLKKLRFWGAVFLPIAGFSSAFVIWLWIMSVDVHWYSTLFAWYASVSMWVSFLCLMFLTILFLRYKGLLGNFTKEHMHDIGKYIFGFSVFWTYLWFSQFLLIWYANNGEETQYFHLRFEQFKPIFFINLLINFPLPFLVLMMNSSKRTYGTLGLIAGFVFLGHWIDFYQMIKPGVWHNYEHAHAHHSHDHSSDKKHGDVYQLQPQDLAPAKAILTQNTPQPETNQPETPTTTTPETKDDHAGHDHDHDHAHGDHGHAAHDHKDKAHDHAGHDHAHGDHDHHSLGFFMGIHFPGLLEIGTLLGFLGLFLFIMFTYLSKASLLASNDPFLEESEHHHT